MICQRNEITDWADHNKIDFLLVSVEKAKYRIRWMIKDDARTICDIIDKDRNIIFDTQKLKQMGLSV